MLHTPNAGKNDKKRTTRPLSSLLPSQNSEKNSRISNDDVAPNTSKNN
jgi:hypothetical protein